MLVSAHRLEADIIGSTSLSGDGRSMRIIENR